MKYHSNTKLKKILIRTKLKKNGLYIDQNGQVAFSKNKMTLLPNAIYFMRHAETYATQNREFMSDNSNNSHICAKGIDDLIGLKMREDYNFDVVIICSNIPRVVETGQIFRLIHPEYNYVFKKKYKGINNRGWEGKAPIHLIDIDYLDYVEREEKKNIFAKSAYGGSWGEVLVNTVNLIKYINRNYKDMRILLISQGSILQAIYMLAHMTEIPWGQYDSQKLFNFDKTQGISNYAKIECVYDKKNM